MNPAPALAPTLARTGRGRRQAAFTLAETMLALVLCAGTLSALYTAVGQSMRIIKMGRDIALGNEVAEQRVSQLHATTFWADLTTISGVSAIVSAAPAAAANFPGLGESFTVSDYPADGNTFTVTRTTSGTIASSGSSLPATTRCVQVVIAARWTGVGGLSRSCTTATLLTKQGI